MHEKHQVVLDVLQRDSLWCRTEKGTCLAKTLKVAVVCCSVYFVFCLGIVFHVGLAILVKHYAFLSFNDINRKRMAQGTSVHKHCSS